MTLRNRFREFVPIVLLFIIVNGLSITLGSKFREWRVDEDLLIGGNLFLFGITFISFLIAKKGLQNENPHAFVRSIFSSIIIKLFITLAAAFIYISMYKKDLNKPAFFALMGLYLVYMFLEVVVLTRMLRRTPNA